MVISRILSPRTHVVTAATPLSEVARRMHRHAVGFLPVRQGGRVVGIVTDRDLALRSLLAVDRGPATRVADVMTTRAHAIRADTTVEAAAGAMQRMAVRRLLVLDAADDLLGVISVSDLAARAARPALAGRVLAHLCDRRGHLPRGTTIVSGA